jgi:hypothetical protein
MTGALSQSRRCGEVGELGAALASWSWYPVNAILRNSGLAVFGLLLLAAPAVCQLEIGQFSNQMSGTVSAGYNGDYGNGNITSDHGLAFGGTGTLSGYYYNPNFVSYNVSPYWNQSRANSAYQSISDASGVNLDSTIFGGSHFPGSINFAKAYDSEGNFSIPGVANYTTKGDSQTFGLTWSELVPNWPTLSAYFQTGSSQYSIYGENSNGTTDNRTLTLRSGYTLEGFSLMGFFSDGTGHSETPEILETSSQPEISSSSSRSYGASVTHALPLRGGFAATATHSEFNSYYEEGNNTGSFNTYTATSTFQPTNKFHFGVSSSYTDNLSSSLSETVLNAGGIAPVENLGEGSHSLELTGNASYSILPNLQGLAFADHREQYFLGTNYGANSYGGGVTYWRLLWGGNFNASLSLSDNTVSTSTQNSLGIGSTVNYSRRFSDGWAFGIGGGYSQNVQTLLVTYTTSNYTASGNLRKRWGKFGWSAGSSLTSTLLTQLPGQWNNSKSFTTSINYTHWVTAGGNYSKSNGSAVQGALGLIVNPLPQPVVPGSELILFNGDSYSFSLSSSPVRRMSIGASYAKAITNNNTAGLFTANNSKMINAVLNYQFRKMYLNGGYSNLVQGFSASGVPAENVSSFYIGISRWFNFF